MKYLSLLIFAGFSLASNAQTKLNSSDNNRAANPFFSSKVSKRASVVDLPQFALVDVYNWDYENKTNNKKEYQDTLKRKYYTNGWLAEQTEIFFNSGTEPTSDITQYTYSGDGSILQELELYKSIKFPDTFPSIDTSRREINTYNEQGLLVLNRREYKNQTTDSWSYFNETRYSYDSATVPNTYFNTVYTERRSDNNPDWEKESKIEFYYDENGVANRLVMSIWVTDIVSGYIKAADYKVSWKSFNPKDATISSSEFNHVHGYTYGGNDTQRISIYRQYDNKENIISEMTYEHDENGDSTLTNGDLYERTYTADDRVATLMEKEYESEVESFIEYRKYYFSDYYEPTALSTESPLQLVKLYPNPAGETLHVTGLSKEVRISVLGATDGKSYSIKKISSEEFNLSNLPSGVYILQAMEPNGKYKHLPFIKR